MSCQETYSHWKHMRSLLAVVENNLAIAAEEDHEPAWTLGACEGLLIVMYDLIDYLQQQETEATWERGD